MGYIYGIYADDELIYIGKTTRDLATRFKEHKRAVYSGDNRRQRVHDLIEEYLSQGAQVQMREIC